jgi:hypothetical protein
MPIALDAEWIIGADGVDCRRFIGTPSIPDSLRQPELRVPTQHRHDLVSGRAGASNAAKFLKPAQWSCPVRSLDDDSAVGGTPEGNLGAGFQS